MDKLVKMEVNQVVQLDHALVVAYLDSQEQIARLL